MVQPPHEPAWSHNRVFRVWVIAPTVAAIALDFNGLARRLVF
jgi:hypothetical protein